MSRIPITKDGEISIKQELSNLKFVERPQISQAIAEARAHGDLKENAEYHAAKELQGLIEAKINEIEMVLANAQVIDVKEIPETGRVIFGSTIKLYDIDQNNEVIYKIVGNLESQPEKGHISIDTPIAKGLVGKFIDDEIKINTPSGDVRYEILEVKHIWYMRKDTWAQKAKDMGYRSRAVFKLEEILKKARTKDFSHVLDLGSSPGGWSDYITKKYPNSLVYAVDIIEMKPIDGVTFIKDSIENLYNFDEVLKLKRSFKLVISDIAPNLTGINMVDSENIYNLNILTINIANNFLVAGGSFIMKTFQNNNLKTLRKNMELSFKLVQTYKPAASKKQSGEIYLYGVK